MTDPAQQPRRYASRTGARDKGSIFLIGGAILLIVLALAAFVLLRPTSGSNSPNATPASESGNR